MTQYTGVIDFQGQILVFPEVNVIIFACNVFKAQYATHQNDNIPSAENR